MSGGRRQDAAPGSPLRLLTVLLCLVAWPLAHGAPAAPATLVEDGVRFQLAGATTFRWMSAIKVYDATLHLGAGESPARVFADIPKRLHLVYHRAFTAEEIVKGGDALLARNVDPAALRELRDRLDRINRAYRDVRPGDSYTLTYVPGAGTTLRLNGTALVTVPGRDFYEAYFRIWLGEKPISETMRDRLLGR